jgi:hypothetical protein
MWAPLGRAGTAAALLEGAHVGGNAFTLLGRQADLQRCVLGHQSRDGLAEDLRGHDLGAHPLATLGPGREAGFNARQALVANPWARQHGAVGRLGPAIGLWRSAVGLLAILGQRR